jgi:hypothetical protein
MADPDFLIENDYIYTPNPRINSVLKQLYDPNDEQGEIHILPTIADIERIFETSILPYLPDPPLSRSRRTISKAVIPFSKADINTLIVCLVLIDASLDSIIGVEQDLPATYQPRRLLELINYDKLHTVIIPLSSINGYPKNAPAEAHIFHWSSERLFPYFVKKLERRYILDSLMGRHANTYLHSYLESAYFRILNPAFVTYLLNCGFSLSKRNNLGFTPIHTIVKNSYAPFAHLSKEERNAHPRSQEVKRYNQFYRTLVLLFQHPTADIDIPDQHGFTVRQIIYDDSENDRKNGNNRVRYNSNDVREAHQQAIGRPLAIERARQQAAVEQIPRLPRNVSMIIRNMMGTNLQNVRATIRQKKQNGLSGGRRKIHRSRKARHSRKN